MIKNLLSIIKITVSIAICYGAVYAMFSKQVISPGEQFPPLALNKQLTSDDLTYLGIIQNNVTPLPDKNISVQDIKAELIVVEFLNAHCVSCQAQVLLTNQVYKTIVQNDKMKDRVKIFGIAVGNNKNEVARFKQKKDIPFPMMPDPEFTSYDLIGYPGGTPFTLLIRKCSDKMIVALSHKGLYSSSEQLLTQIDFALRRIPADSGEQKVDTGYTASNTEDRKLFLDLSRGEVRRLVEKSMLNGARFSGYQKIVDLKRIRLSDGDYIYQGYRTGNNSKALLYSKLIHRKPVCDVCHGVHFIITFDNKGIITDFTSVYLTKATNVEWEESDSSFIKEKLLGRSLEQKLSFDPDIDAVATATMTSALIFNSINRLGKVYKEIAVEK